MKNNIHQDKIIILDFGSQYTQLIGRRVRESGVFCLLMSGDASLAQIKAAKPKGIILSGSPESVNDQTLHVHAGIFALGIPILGICFGMQTMAAQLGGKVASSKAREFGYAQVQIDASCALFANIQDAMHEGAPLLDVWMSHGDKVDALPQGFRVIGSSANAPIAAMADEARQFYALQFHPEVTHTKSGAALLTRFVVDICQCQKLWTPANIIDDQIKHIRAQVGSDAVILGLSGGVDSSVVAALLHRAIGKQLTCVFVDNGLLRLNEGDKVMQMFAENLGIKVIRVNAEKRFLKALKGVQSPEKKRKIIGNLFVQIFEEQAAKITAAKWLAQGTIYPDVIESAGAGNKAQVIKTHHNVGGLPLDMRLKLVEPLRELFKDEVRRIGVALGLPEAMVYRHPFPGPGLGVRILGKVKKRYADLLRLADDIFIEELYRHDLYQKTAQAFAVFLPVKSVGVMGDGRRYDYVIALRAVETVDFMTANSASLSHEFLALVSRRIINEVDGISRVVYDISSKPPATIEWE